MQRRNDITIDLIPNNYFIQLSEYATRTHENQLKLVELAPMQIKKVEIYKSYVQHITDIVVELDNMQSELTALLSEGKYIARLNINADLTGDNPFAKDNYFICSDMVNMPVVQSDAVYGFIPTISVKVTLKSITRTRLEIENNFPFELGGRNGKGAAGIGKSPKDFMNYDLKDLYTRNYMDEGMETSLPWDTTYCDWLEPVHQVETTPSNGYQMVADTNFQALEYFFKHYPIFNTPFDWLLDDFNTSPTSPTIVRISDLAWWKAWKPNINVELSKIINMETTPGDKDSSPEYRSASSMKFFGIQMIENVPYYDWVVFYVKNGFPKIWAVDVSSGKPIPMNVWNAIHEDSRVMTPTGAVKEIKNPMYREYLTFMTPKEIEESQLHLNMFQELNPVLEKYTFNNIYVGEVDIHTIVEFKLNHETLPDRIGMGYQVLHTYNRQSIKPPAFDGQSVMGVGEPRTSPYTYNYSLNSEIIFLVIDQGDLSIDVSGNEDASRIEPTTPFDSDNYYQTDDCDEMMDESAVGSDGRGIPGNSSIGDQAMALYGNGFKYVWGGKKSPSQGLDCSGLTSLAVKNAGIGNFPGGTYYQRKWCKSNAGYIQNKQDIQRGDILFFNWGNGRTYGHTGVAISNTQFVHASGGRKKNAQGRYYSYGKGKVTNFANYHPKNMQVYRLKGGSK